MVLTAVAGGTAGPKGQEVVFTDEVEADVSAADLREAAVETVTFGADDDDIDLDEI